MPMALGKETVERVAQQKRVMHEFCRAIVQLLTMFSPQDLMDARCQYASREDEDESLISSQSESGSEGSEDCDSREELPENGFITTFASPNRACPTPSQPRQQLLPNQVPLKEQSRVRLEKDDPSQTAIPPRPQQTPMVQANPRPSPNYQQFASEPHLPSGFTYANGISNRRSTTYNVQPASFPKPSKTESRQRFSRSIGNTAAHQVRPPVDINSRSLMHQHFESNYEPNPSYVKYNRPRQLQGQSEPHRYTNQHRRQLLTRPPTEPDCDEPNLVEPTRYPFYADYQPSIPRTMPPQVPAADQTMGFLSQSNSGNTQEQQASRRWFQNKYYYNGFTEDDNSIGTDEWLEAICTYPFSQWGSDEVMVPNIGQACVRKAKRWGKIQQCVAHTISEFETGVRDKWTSQTETTGVTMSHGNECESSTEAIPKQFSNVINAPTQDNWNISSELIGTALTCNATVFTSQAVNISIISMGELRLQPKQSIIRFSADVEDQHEAAFGRIVVSMNETQSKSTKAVEDTVNGTTEIPKNPSEEQVAMSRLKSTPNKSPTITQLSKQYNEASSSPNGNPDKSSTEPRVVELVEWAENVPSQDKWYTTMRRRAKTEPMKLYRLENGHLYRRRENKPCDGDGAWCLCVPSEKKEEILRGIHDVDVHPGVWKLTRLATAKYFWPKMKKDCYQYVSKCESCKPCRTADVGVPAKVTEGKAEARTELPKVNSSGCVSCVNSERFKVGDMIYIRTKRPISAHIVEQTDVKMYRVQDRNGVDRGVWSATYLRMK